MSNALLLSKRIAFIDRDGVINKKAPEHQYITQVNDFVFNEGVFNVLQTLQRDGYELIIITNQRGVARGLMTENDLSVIHQHMLDELRKKDVKILDIFYCPHDKDQCDCRKPKPGLLKQACEKYPIIVPESILISDSEDEVKMGDDFGIESTFLVRHDHPEDFFKSYSKKIRLAFIKYGGLSSGGTEKMLQTIAANVSRKKFQVDYFYCDSSPYTNSDYKHPGTDLERIKYMESKHVRCIEFKVTEKNIKSPLHTWKGTDFWKKFKEVKYDIVQTGRAGHKEYPFNKIKKVPIIDILALNAGVDNQYNISKVLHISHENAERWIRAGGDKKRVDFVSLPIETTNYVQSDYRKELNLENIFVFGMHQRNSDAIYSEIPLRAYKIIESPKTAFVLLGGSNKYKKQAEELGINNIHFLPETGDQNTIFKFLNTLNVYAHGRHDGEVNSQAMAEAMYCGLPIVSHISNYNNGHIENIGEAGLVADSLISYIDELKLLIDNKSYYDQKRLKSRERFSSNYELKSEIKKIEDIYLSVYSNPYPNKFARFVSGLHWTQNIKILLKYVYLKFNK